MNKNKLTTIIILVVLLLATSLVLIKTDFANNVFKTKADVSLQSNETMFEIGKEVNRKMKQLAGNTNSEITITFQTVAENITKIVKSNTISNSYKKDDYKVSTYDSPKPIYMWYSNGTIFYYTEATKIYLNEDSSYLFSLLTKLTNIDLSNFDTSKVTDMSDMFLYCNSLQTLDVSKLNTSKVTNMSAMFYRCSSLTSLDVSKFITSNVTDMSYMFGGCSSLTTLNLSKFNTSKVTNMSNMFFECESLVSLNISSFDTSKVTNMHGMFRNCKKITSIDLSKFNTSKVTNMSYMFYNCNSLANIDVSKFNTSNVTDMSYMFCMFVNNLLTTIDLSNFDTSKVTNMSHMFSGCEKLAILDLSKFNTSNVTNMSDMFDGCESLASLNVSKFNTSKVTDMSYMFRGCSSLTSLNLSNFNTSNVVDMSGMFWYCNSLQTLDVSKLNTSKVTNMSGMFYGCRALTTLNLSNFKTSNVTDMSDMFGYCSSLTILDLSKFNTSKVTNMSCMFYGCRALTTLNLSNFKTSNVTDMSDMFSNCSSLTSFDLSNFDTSKVTDMSYMLSGCSSLTSLDLSNWNTSNVTNMSHMFYNSSMLKTIYVGSKFVTTKVTYAIDMFWYCDSLVGERGTKYNSGKIDKTYARVDTPNSPGYFTGIYKIVYHGNGGLYGTKDTYTDPREYKYNVVYPGANNGKELIYSNDNFFKRTGYTFKRWETKSGYNGWSAGYSGDSDKLWKWGNGEYHIGEENPCQLDLYATWTPKQYDIVFNGNGGAHGDSKSFTEKATYNQIFTIDESWGSWFKKTGYTFAGWYDNSNGTGTNYDKWSKNWVWDYGWKLYAKWVPNTNTITFDKNDNDATGSMSDITKTYGVALNAPKNQFQKEGYILKYWNLYADGTHPTKIYDEGPIGNLTATGNTVVTLYAIWEEVKEEADISELDIKENNILFESGYTLTSIKGMVSSDNVVLKNREGNIKTSDKLATNDKLVIGDNTYDVAVLGDTTSDGEVTIRDVAIAYRYFRKKITPNSVEFIAADLNNDNDITIKDVALVYRKSRGK